MSVLSVVLLLLYLAVVIVGIVAILKTMDSRARLRMQREHFINTYAFPLHIRDEWRKAYPALGEYDVELAERALRSYFIAHLRAGKFVVAMPSRAVDALWHEFILDTRAYHSFCQKAFDGYFHHIPTAAMTPGRMSDMAMWRIWRLSCRGENIDPKLATQLPLLFAIDGMLRIPDGNEYSLSNFRQSAAACGGAGGCGGGAAAGGCCGSGCGGGCGGG